MKTPFLPALILAVLFSIANTQAEEHLGPPVYLASVYEVDGKAVLHWKYNIARPEFVEVKVMDAEGAEVARVKRLVRQTDVTGKSGPFTLVALKADGATGPEAVAPVGPVGEAGGVLPAEVPMPPVPSVSRIGITPLDGRAKFVHQATGKVFHPIGMNYVPLRHGDHAAFEAATSVDGPFYDPLEAETVLRLLRQNGYNTVRVFLAGRRAENPGLSGEAETVGIYTPYLDNLADFLQRSAANGIHVIINFADVNLPQNKYFREKVGREDGTHNLFHESGVLAFRELVASTLGYLKAKNPDLLKTILGVQFNNEVDAKLTLWPFTEKGAVSTANGKTYDMSVPEDRMRCYEDGLAYYYKQLCAAVDEVDKDLLTCEGLFVGAAVGRDHRQGAAAFDPANLAKGFEWEWGAGLRVPPPLTVLAATPLDFVDIHLYPPGPLATFEEQVEDLLQSSLYREGVAAGLGSKKPVILGEFGAFKKDVEADTKDGITGGVNRWKKVRNLACGKYGFVGYIGWSLETFDQTDICQAMAMGPDFLRTLREEFSFPDKPLDAAPDPSAAAKNPLVLSEVAPTGPGRGFLVPQKLTP
jgi:hypothetical protein